MPEPRVHDIRRGLTPEVLDSLRRAQRVSLAVKDMRTAVLGFWMGEELSVALIDSDSLLLEIRAVTAGDISGAIHTFKPRPTPPPAHRVVWTTQSAATDPFWSRLLGVLREGDVVRLANDQDKPGMLLLHVYANQSRVASLRLPRSHQARSVA